MIPALISNTAKHSQQHCTRQIKARLLLSWTGDHLHDLICTPTALSWPETRGENASGEAAVARWLRSRAVSWPLSTRSLFGLMGGSLKQVMIYKWTIGWWAHRNGEDLDREAGESARVLYWSRGTLAQAEHLRAERRLLAAGPYGADRMLSAN